MTNENYAEELLKEIDEDLKRQKEEGLKILEDIKNDSIILK